MTSATPPDRPGPPAPGGSSWLPGPAPEPWPPTAAPPAPASPAHSVPLGTVHLPPAGVPVEGPPEGHGHVAPTPLGRHRRRPWAVIVLSVLLVLVTALSTYLWIRTVRFEDYAQGIEDQARVIGTDLTTLREEHDGTVGELAAVNEQLTTAQARITELADEKAQLGDDREIQRQLVDYQQRVSQAAANVASALSTCIDGQNQLIGYLENAAAYDPTDLQRFKDDVTRVCGIATDANTQLQQELAAGTDG